jgi:hypothetical protein
MFRKVMTHALELYGNTETKKPTKASQEIRELQEVIQNKSKEVNNFFGLFPSAKSTKRTAMEKRQTTHVYAIIQNLQDMQFVHKKYFELSREKATEAVLVPT